MNFLEERIVKDGCGIGTEIVKVDSFLNHQIDVKLMDSIGEAVAREFAGCGATKILTVEASGIAIACAVSRYMDYLPVVFAKKAAPSTMTEGYFAAKAHSFTKNTDSILRVSDRFLCKEDKLLIVDDFLANGEASMALSDIAEEAGAEVVGFAAAIEKQFQHGADRLRERGIKVCSLAVISEIKDGNFVFCDCKE